MTEWNILNDGTLVPKDDRPINVPEVSTDEIYNDEEPGLDISRVPLAIGLSRGYYFSILFESLDRIQTDLNGGSVSINVAGVQLDTSSTSGNDAAFDMHNHRNNDGFDGDIVLAGTFDIKDGDGSRLSYLTVGEVQRGNQGFGIKLDNGDIEGAAHDGTSESTTTLMSNPGTGTRGFTAHFKPGTEVEFFIDGLDSNDGKVSSNLPSGDDFDATIISGYAKTETSATRNLVVRPLEYVRGPGGVN